MKNLLYGIEQPVLFHVVTFLGKDGASPSGYLSTDPNLIGDQLTAIERLGGAGVVALTYGPTVNPFMHDASMELCRQCSERRLLFALCFDPWTVREAEDKNAAMIAALEHPDTEAMLSSRAYIPEHAVLDFSTGVDPAAVMGAVPGIQYWMRHHEYSWPETENTVEALRQANANPFMRMPAVFSGFNDGWVVDRNVSVWDHSQPVRLIDAGAGTMFHRAVSLIPAQAKYVQYVTWNDYFEGTQLEPFAMMLTRGIA